MQSCVLRNWVKAVCYSTWGIQAMIALPNKHLVTMHVKYNVHGTLIQICIPIYPFHSVSCNVRAWELNIHFA